VIPEDGDVLDLMSSWRSHLPPLPRTRRVVGLGMNAAEMRDNPQLSAALVHDLNREPSLPLRAGAFDVALLSVSMQYLVHPLEVFADVARVLRPGAPFVVVLSHRCFPTKAVKIWNDCRSMRERMELGMAYFRFAGGFEEVHGVELRPNLPAGADPVVAVIGRSAAGEPATDSPKVVGSGWRRR
jgi:SAM-dependent methyltransferase